MVRSRVCLGSRRRAAARRSWMLALTAAGVLLGLGCQSVQRVDTSAASPYVVAEGRAKVDPITYADQSPWTLAFSGPVEASAQAPLDASIPDAGQRALMARAEARRACLRALAQRVLALPDADGRPLSQSVAKDGALAQALESMLEERAQAQCTVADRQVLAKTVIQGQDLLVLLRAHGVALQCRLSSLAPERRKAFENDVYGRALTDMRRRLKEQIFNVTGPDGRPLRGVFEAHPQRMESLGQALLLLQADAIDYHEDGECLVKVYFEQAKAQALAYPPAPFWAFWRAFSE